MFVPMPEGVRLSAELPNWVKLSIADAVVTFGRLLKNADLKLKVKLAEYPATANFLAQVWKVWRGQRPD